MLHDRQAQLDLAQPLLPASSAPSRAAARRYVAGRASGDTIHVLAPRALRERATTRRGVGRAPAPRPRRALRAARRRRRPTRACAGWRAVRWAWLALGAAECFTGRTRFARAIVARRLREGAAAGLPARAARRAAARRDGRRPARPRGGRRGRRRASSATPAAEGGGRGRAARGVRRPRAAPHRGAPGAPTSRAGPERAASARPGLGRGPARWRCR